MRGLTVRQLPEVVGGRLRMATLATPAGDSAAVNRIVVDSRQVGPGDTFWGLAGARYDGADFAEAAYAAQASGVVVANRYIQPPPGCWSLEVEDTLAALSRLAAWNRARFSGTMVAVTGSVGKTTARQMIHSVLSTLRTGSTSPKNYNNHVGVPLSLFGVEPQHDFAVLEVAASRPGEVRPTQSPGRPADRRHYPPRRSTPRWIRQSGVDRKLESGTDRGVADRRLGRALRRRPPFAAHRQSHAGKHPLGRAGHSTAIWSLLAFTASTAV